MIEDLVAKMRKEYEAQGLDEAEMAEDPFDEFTIWFEGVVAAGLEEPNTMVVATASADGKPSVRAVLMKGLGPDGLVFYTNLESRKSLELKENPYAAATFVWVPLHRQVRFEGRVEPVDDADADRYFGDRPRGAQIAAYASEQSQPVAARVLLDEKYLEFESHFDGQTIPRPASWGGWRLLADSVEFWQGQPNRFHDRVRYLRTSDGWEKERLAP